VGVVCCPSLLLLRQVTGISTFPIPHLNVQRANASNDFGVIPATLDNLYKVSQAHRKQFAKAKGTAAATSQAVIEFQGQSFTPAESDPLPHFTSCPHLFTLLLVLALRRSSHRLLHQ
jgi:hypothetical protein